MKVEEVFLIVGAENDNEGRPILSIYHKLLVDVEPRNTVCDLSCELEEDRKDG